MELLSLESGYEGRDQPPESFWWETARADGFAPEATTVEKARLAAFMTEKRRERAGLPPQSLKIKDQIYLSFPHGETHSTRVLYLEPATELDAPLYCSLRQVSVGLGNSFTSEGIDYDDRTRWTSHAVDLDTGEPVWYTALSYLWGPPDFCEEILIRRDRGDPRELARAYGSAKGKGVEGNTGADERNLVHSRMITANLDGALRHLRDPCHVVVLWIDQLCINQADLGEKSSQIALMSLIYRCALNTTIWLGSEPDYITDLSPRIVRTNGEIDTSHINLVDTAALVTNGESKVTEADQPAIGAFEILEAVRSGLEFVVDRLDASFFEALRLPCSRQQARVALTALFNREWFSRVWVKQEVVLSQRSVVRCGQGIDKRTTYWDAFASTCLSAIDSGFFAWLANDSTNERVKVGSTQSLEDTGFSGAEIVKNLERARLYAIIQISPESISTAMIETRYAAASNMRDKVFGLLGMTVEKMDVNYSISVGEVYRRATILMMEGNLGENLLNRKQLIAPAYALSCVDHEPRDDAPSWVPDWSRPRKTSALGCGTLARGIYAADSSLKAAKAVTLADDGMVLEFTGRIADVVCELADVCENPGILTQSSGEETACMALYQFARSHHFRIPDDEDSLDVIWKTLVTGKDGQGYLPCPPSYRKIFEKVFSREKADTEIPVHARESSQSSRSRKRKEKVKQKMALPPRPKAWEKLLPEVQQAYSKAVKNRRLAVTKQEYLALLPNRAQKGDYIAVLKGAIAPFVIRPNGTSGYQPIGECYVHGIMNGRLPGTASETLVFLNEESLVLTGAMGNLAGNGTSSWLSPKQISCSSAPQSRSVFVHDDDYRFLRLIDDGPADCEEDLSPNDASDSPV